jgi:hypothetical protein
MSMTDNNETAKNEKPEKGRPYFVQVPHGIVRDPKLTVYEKVLLFDMFSWSMNGMKKDFWRSNSNWARDCCCSIRIIRYATLGLVKKGYLTVIPYQGQANHYTINLEHPRFSWTYRGDDEPKIVSEDGIIALGGQVTRPPTKREMAERESREALDNTPSSPEQATDISNPSKKVGNGGGKQGVCRVLSAAPHATVIGTQCQGKSKTTALGATQPYALSATKRYKGK